MFDTVVIVLESRTCVVGWVNANALDFAGKLLLQCLKCEQVVTMNQDIVEQIIVGHSMCRMIGFLGVFQKNTWFEPRTDFLADPGKFEFLFVRHDCSVVVFCAAVGAILLREAADPARFLPSKMPSVSG